MSDGKGANGVPVFITKLLAMVEDQANNSLLYWSANGETFIVTDADKLAEEELPKYFKHKNFTSLVRQLNMYGFHKVTAAGGVKNVTPKDQPQLWEFVHPCVQRAHPELLVHIKRKENSQKSRQRTLAKEDPHVILGEMKVLQTAHNKLVGKFKSVQTQNEELWNEVAEHRRRHAQQQWKIDRIMKYLAALYKNGDIELPAALAEDLPPSAKKARTEIKEEAPELSPHRRAASAPVMGSIMSPLADSPELLAGSPTLHSDLEAHFDVYDEHLDKKKEQLHPHLDESFINSIFNPPSTHTDVAMHMGTLASPAPPGTVGSPLAANLGGKYQAENPSDDFFDTSFEIFTPLDGLLDTDMGMAPVNDAVVPSTEATSG